MGSCPSGELSWWGVVLVGSRPAGKFSLWGIVLKGSCPGGESSRWELSSGELSYNKFPVYMNCTTSSKTKLR